MLNLNRATVIGHMTRDPEIRTTPNGQTVGNFSVATNRRWTDQQGQQQEETEFHDIVVWGKLAEIAEQIFHKGNLVYAEGRLQTQSWEAQDGSKRQRTEIVADNLINLEKQPSTGGTNRQIDQTNKKEDLDQRPATEKNSNQSNRKQDDDETEDVDTINIDEIPL